MAKRIPPNGIPLTGDMWWSEPNSKGRLHKFILFPERCFFIVEHDGWEFTGTLPRRDGCNYRGSFESSDGGSGTASCTLVEERSGEYRLKGTWKQDGNPEQFEWHAALE
jgi:hypothetical protein